LADEGRHPGRASFLVARTLDARLDAVSFQGLAVMRRQKEVEVFSLSFIDCICCGFGAIVLLLVLSEFGSKAPIEISRTDLHNQIRTLQEQIYDIRGDSEELNRELQGRIDAL